MPVTVTTTTTVTRGGVTTTTTTTTVDGQPVKPATDPNDFPRELAAVTTGWLSSVLNKEVTAFDTTPLEQGVLSDLGIVALTYADGPSAGPASVVLKFAKGLDESRASAVASDSYRKEIQFFETLGKEVPFRSPECIALFRDKDKPNEYFCIVMENMNDAGYAVLDQVAGLSMDQMKALNNPVAKLHADFWGKELLDTDWLNPGRETGTVRPWFDLWMDGFRPDPKGIMDRYVASFKQKDADAPGSASPTLEALQTAPFQKLAAIICDEAKLDAVREKIIAKYTGRPCTLIHADLRSDNIFKSTTADEYAFIDFQMLSKGPPGLELCQLYAAALTNIDDYDHLEEMIEDYYAKLIAANPAAASYTKDMLIDDFATGCILLFFGVVGALTPMIEALLAMPEHPLWPLAAVWGARTIKCMEKLDCAGRAERMLADVEEGTPPEAGA